MAKSLMVLALGTAVVVAGCGGGSGKAHVTSAGGHPDPAAIAAKIGCEGYAADTSGSTELYTATDGTCSYQGQDVTIVTFASSAAFAKWQAAANSATGGDGTTALGDRYAIEAPNADIATSIAGVIGGTTQ